MRKAGVLLIAAMIAFAGCGPEKNGTAIDGGSRLDLSLTKASSMLPGSELDKVVRYEVSVSGDDMPEPVKISAENDGAPIVADGIPSGGERRINVDAFNGRGDIIFQAGAEGVEIGEGITEVELALESVPVFANLREGGVVDNTRLVFKVFGDPGHPIEITDSFGDADSLLGDIARKDSVFNTDASTWRASMAPAPVAPGRHKFTVRDRINSRFSTVNVDVTDGAMRRAAPLLFGSEVSGANITWLAP